MGLSEVLHKIVDVAAGVGQRQDLHDEIDSLDDSAEAAPEDEAAPEPAPVDVPAVGTAPEPEPVQAPEPAPVPVDELVHVQEPVQEHVQEEGSSGEAFA